MCLDSRVLLLRNGSVLDVTMLMYFSGWSFHEKRGDLIANVWRCLICGCQVLGTDELNAYLNKYRLELDPHLEALVGRLVVTGGGGRW